MQETNPLPGRLQGSNKSEAKDTMPRASSACAVVFAPTKQTTTAAATDELATSGQPLGLQHRLVVVQSRQHKPAPKVQVKRPTHHHRQHAGKCRPRDRACGSRPRSPQLHADDAVDGSVDAKGAQPHVLEEAAQQRGEQLSMHVPEGAVGQGDGRHACGLPRGREQHEETKDNANAGRDKKNPKLAVPATGAALQEGRDK